MGEEKEYFLYGVASCKPASQWSGRRPSGEPCTGKGDGDNPTSDELSTPANVAGRLLPALRLPQTPCLELSLICQRKTGLGEAR